MAAQARGHQQPVSKPAKSGYGTVVIATLTVFAVLVVILGYSEEEAKPGYSIVSRIFRSAEVVATSQKTAEDKKTEFNRSVDEQIKRSNEWRAERKFMEANTRPINRVYCQNTKDWQTLSEEEKQRVRDYMKKHYNLLIESDACP